MPTHNGESIEVTSRAGVVTVTRISRDALSVRLPNGRRIVGNEHRIEHALDELDRGAR